MITIFIILGIGLVIYFKYQILMWVLAFGCWIKTIKEN